MDSLLLTTTGLRTLITHVNAEVGILDSPCTKQLSIGVLEVLLDSASIRCTTTAGIHKFFGPLHTKNLLLEAVGSRKLSIDVNIA